MALMTEDLLETLPQPIAVVGNGPVREKGTDIDAHPSVIRLNNFRVQGYEEHIGSRLSAWCVNCWWDVEWKDHGVPAFTVFSLEDDNRRVERWCKDYGCQVLTPRRHWTQEVRELKAKKPSTGLLLLYALDMMKIAADVYGFDGMVKGHYWDEKHEHDHPGEASVLSKLHWINLIHEEG